MEPAKIVLKLKEKEYSKILDLAETVYERLLNNIIYSELQPMLPALKAGIVVLRKELERWGPQGNRGSHQDHVNLEFWALRVKLFLESLALKCENTVLRNVPVGERAAALATTGFPLKKQKSRQGVLEEPQNFHHFIARNLQPGDVKLRWEQPLNVTTHTNIKDYVVYRSSVNDFSTAVIISHTTRTTFTDTPGSGKWFYWVAAENNMGEGVISHSVMVTVV